MPKPQDLDRQSVLRQFDRRAPRFEAADYLLREVEQRMLERLDLIRLTPAGVLDVGCGLGKGLRQLLNRYPETFGVGVDLSPAMVARARPSPPSLGGRLREFGARFGARFGASWVPRRGSADTASLVARTSLAAADAHQLPFVDASFDLVWSNLAYHWFDDPLSAIGEWHRVIRPGGLLMFSALGVDTLGELRQAGHPVLELPDMHDIGDALSAAGFAEPVMDAERLTVTWQDLRRMVEEVRILGGDAARSRQRGLVAPARYVAGLDRLERQLRSSGEAGAPLSMTFEVVYGHAWCPSPKRLPRGLSPVTFVPRSRPAGPGV